MSDDEFNPPRNTIAAFANLSRVGRLRHRLAMLALDAGMVVSNVLTPEDLAEAVQDDSDRLDRRLDFERQADDTGHNVYVFETERGDRIELPPDATVSELQNRI